MESNIHTSTMLLYHDGWKCIIIYIPWTDHNIDRQQSAEYFNYQYFMQYFMQGQNHSKSTVNACDVITFILFLFVGLHE